MKALFSIVFFCISFSQISAYAQNPAQPKIGVLKWKFKSNGKFFSSPTVSSNKVFIGGNDSVIYAVNIKTGRKAWAYKTDGSVNSSPVVFKNTVYVGSFDGHLYALDVNNGKIKWKFATNGEKRMGARGLWGMQPSDLYMEDQYDLIRSSPVVDMKSKVPIVYFGSSDGYIYALNAADGELIWKFKTNGIIRASPVLNNGKLYIGSWDTYIYALDQKTGKLVWKYKTGEDDKVHLMEGIQASAVVYGGKLFVGSRDGFFYCLDAETGELNWKYDGKGSWIVASAAVKNETVYLTTSDSYLFIALNILTGKEKYSIKTSGYNFSSPLVNGNNIYFGDFSGKIYSVNAEHGKIEGEFETTSRLKYKEEVLDREGKLDFVHSAGKSNPALSQTGIEVMDKFYKLGSIVSSPIIANGIIYFGSADGYLYAVKMP
ncbi:PQQ-binding-like beta-propeller repeat protein [Pedobacter foliorum]|uniref:beta-alanine-activating enzyme beta-propeller domain-containing protein n=1 Tax=Pedobacter foliorum TaxID=2739058 RepID=UPI00156548FA|nr:PQQ-binding-like beta-propeller repeat protein [Pedobacter foliorum]NRF39923.1 PQQ-binding-like beta-propeller repeat protein [Pedobacter foliorum]